MYGSLTHFGPPKNCACDTVSVESDIAVAKPTWEIYRVAFKKEKALAIVSMYPKSWGSV